jgi:uncharacterized protein with von Willebrand factor type A (vWA) domain
LTDSTVADDSPIMQQDCPTLQLVAFTRLLANAGLPVTADRTRTFLAAAAALDAGRRSGLYWAGRATLCAEPDDVATYDRAFEAWFGAEPQPGAPTQPREPDRRVRRAVLEPGPGSTADDDPADSTVLSTAAGEELLRHRDIADLDPAQRDRLRRQFDRLPARMPLRGGGRRRPHRRGRIDVSATLARQRRRHGEIDRLCYRRAEPRVRPVTWLIDVSGSMAPYADALLRTAHRLTQIDRYGRGRPRVETFTMGTRLTRITPALRLADPDTGLQRAGQIVPDWSGGTLLGETLRAFVRRWAAPGLTRGGVTVICSDGWERGDPQLLGEQAELLARLSHRLIWLNPHRGKPGYRPVQAGIAASLPHCDRLVAGHSLAALETLCEVIADA